MEEGEQGPCAKFQGSCGMMVVGLVMFPLSLYMVGWNENNYICEQKRIIFASVNAEEKGCDSSGVSNEFVYFSCSLDTQSFRDFTAADFLDADDAFYRTNARDLENVKFSSASARMTVELSQCKEACEETKVKHNGRNTVETSCMYSMVWSDKELPTIPYTDRARRSCPGVEFQGPGRRLLRAATAEKLGSHTQYASDVRTAVSGKGAKPFVLNSDLVVQLSPNQDALQEIVVPTDAHFGPSRNDCRYTAQGVPFVGCLRLRFQKNGAKAVSVFTHVAGEGVTKKQSMPSSWGCPGKPWQALVEGTFSKEHAVDNLHAANAAMVIILRIVLCALAWLSVFCILSPISAIAEAFGGLANMIPCVGGYLEDFIEGVVDTVLCVISCSVGLSCSLFVMAVVWLFMRPVYGAGMLLACVALCACACAVRQQAGAPKKRRAREVAGGPAMEMQNSVSSVGQGFAMQAQAMAQPMVGQPAPSGPPLAPMTAQPFAQPMMGQPNPYAQPVAVAAQPVVAQAVAVPQPSLMQITCPAGMGPGSALLVQAPDGRQLQVIVPAGVGPGMQFQAQV